MTGHVLKHCPAMQKFTAKLPIKKELFTTLAAQFEASARVCSAKLQNNKRNYLPETNLFITLQRGNNYPAIT